MTKTKKPYSQGVSFGRPRSNLNAQQAAELGFVIIAFNMAEEKVVWLFAQVLRIGADTAPIFTRINGLDGQIAIIKFYAKAIGAPENINSALSEVFSQGEGFQGYKIHRDSIVHTRPLDARSATGMTTRSKAQRVVTLISAPFLRGLYQRLEIIKEELDCLHTALGCHAHSQDENISDQHRSRLQSDIAASMSQYQLNRNQRLSLPPLPEPPEGPVSEVVGPPPLDE